MTLEQKIQEKVQGEIGDLITEDDLKKIIERGIEKALFDKREDHSGSFHKTHKPSIVDEMVEKHISEQMRQAVEAYLTENPDKVKKAMDNAIANGVGEALITALDNRFVGIFRQGVEQMQYQGMLPQ